MVSQTPKLFQVNDKDYIIGFGVQSNAPENLTNEFPPSMLGVQYRKYELNLGDVTHPARGNTPDFVRLQFTIEVVQLAVGAIATSPVFFVNRRTQQMVGVSLPTPKIGEPATAQGCVGFYCGSSDTVQIFVDNSIVNIEALINVSLFTADGAYYLTAVAPLA